MGSIPDQDPLIRQIRETARAVACRERLPWDLRALREAGLCAAWSQKDEYRDKREGLGGVSFEEYAQRAIEEEILATAKRLRASALAGELKPPPDKDIEEALVTFSAQDWSKLIAEFRRGDLEVLRTYVLENLEELERNLGLYKLKTIRGAVAWRGVRLAFGQSPRLVRVTDPIYIQQWQEEARYRNLTGASPPSNSNRSWDEMGHPPAIAEGLGTSRYMVTKMLERMEQVPLEKFGGDILEYWLWVADPKAYERYRLLENDAGK